jgi:hypothetical protein
LIEVVLQTQGGLIGIRVARRRVGRRAADQDGSFKGQHFAGEVIRWALRWYFAFPISYRDLALMLSDRGVGVELAPADPTAGAADAKVQSPRQAQAFLFAHSFTYGHFRPRRHLMTAKAYREGRATAFRVWQQETYARRAT